MALRASAENPTAWYVPRPRMEPVRNDNFIGVVAEGGPVNFTDVFFNPHGHGTHTECVGHIAAEKHLVGDSLGKHFMVALLISVKPKLFDGSHKIYQSGDLVISLNQVQSAVAEEQPEALIIRTLPNDSSKTSRQYSSTNPPYLHADAAQWIRERGIAHLLIDLPSVDREEDRGTLLAHRAFWNYPDSPKIASTITELIYAPPSLPDGLYVLNLQTANFSLDATPSRPIVFPLANK